MRDYDSGESRKPPRPYLTVAIPMRHIPQEEEEDCVMW